MLNFDPKHMVVIQPQTQRIMTVTPDGRSVFFYAGGGSEDWVGHLYLNSQNQWTFVGDVDASAQALFDALALITGIAKRREGDGEMRP